MVVSNVSVLTGISDVSSVLNIAFIMLTVFFKVEHD